MLVSVKQNPLVSITAPDNPEEHPMSTHDEGQPTRSAAIPDLDSSPGVGHRRRRGFRVTAAAAVALGLAVGGGAMANAATSGSSSSTTAPSTHFGGHDGFGGTPPAAMGKVAKVGSNTFTLTNRDGTTVTVDVGSTTTYLDRGVTSPSFTDVTVGAQVAVFGTDTADTVTATKVAIGGPGAHGPGGNDGDGGMPAPMSGSGPANSASTSASSVTA